jgi:putative transposase
VNFHKQAHAVYHCQYHLVLSTKYRKPWFNSGIFAWWKLKLVEIRKWYPELYFESVNHDIDHVHILVSIPPKMSVSSVVRIIKSNTSRELKQKFPFLKEVYWGTDGVWSDGYFVSTTGINDAVIKRYIEKQGEEDSGQALLEL